MNRRHFLSTSAAGATAFSIMGEKATAQTNKQQYIELREYEMVIGDGKKRLQNFIQNAAMPAWKRQGIGPIGVFTPKYGQNRPTLYVLLPHDSMESVMTSNEKMLADKEFFKAGKNFLETDLSKPGFVRIKSSVMLAFSHLPKVSITSEAGSRIFELRTYESHSLLKAKKKIKMFNEGGEIAIFKKTGLNPVFFGETIIGERMPNLVYMLGFDDMAQRDKNWSQFGASPEWKALKEIQEYKNTVSNITDVILRPTGFSEI